MSLLLFSFVFALPGITGTGGSGGASAAVEIGSQAATQRPVRGESARETSTAVVISAPKRVRAAARQDARTPAVGRRAAVVGRPSFDADVRDLTPPPPAPAAASPSTSKPAIGDGVREVGDAVTATVHGTGAAAAPLLGPPVSQVVQDVLDLLSSILQGATSAVGGALDKTVPR